MNKYRVTALLLLCTFTTITHAQSLELAVSAGERAEPIYEAVPNDPLNARIYTLRNGMKVYFSVYQNAPRIHTYIAVKAGSKNDPREATGLAHYLEHMVFKGTDVYGTKDYKSESIELARIEALYEQHRKTKDKGQRAAIYRQIDSISGVAANYAIANEYDKMLATIGAKETNAFTSFDQTVYVNDIPSNQIENWLKIESERFRKPVLRLFHTELEAVYEEKNRGLDSDINKLWESVFAGLFKDHTYGTQTTIGTIEHLKNPSMLEINRYYQKYYVPNNMAIIMSGDFDPDKVIVQIEKHFGTYTSHAVEPYKFAPEAPIKEKVVKEVLGPSPEQIALAWRFSGEGTKDADICMLLSGMLSNGSAGIMDLQLNQAQKVLSSSAFYYPLKDYGVFYIGGEPKEGQTLEEVEKLLLSQLEVIKKGEFPPWLIDAVITDLKLKKTKELESNASRADVLLNSFVNTLEWKEEVKRLERISKISKQELMFFANKNFNSKNYVVVYKRTGEDKLVAKVEKPLITPVEVDRINSSQFVKDVESAVPPAITPKFIDYETDLLKTTLKAEVPLIYNKNAENNLFELYYYFDMGSNNHKLFPVAVKYIPFLASSNMSASRVKEELYTLGCYFNVHCDEESIWVSLSGLNDNFAKALEVFEKVLSEAVVDESVLKNMIGDLIKERNDNKLHKSIILQKGMTNYARYGALNPFSNVLSDADLHNISASQIKEVISGLLRHNHKVLYYGPKELGAVKMTLNQFHRVPEKTEPLPPAQIFTEKTFERSVYVIDFDMQQAEILMLSNGEKYKTDRVPVIQLYNSYFGGGMSSILFQDLRESKALAYSTMSRYTQPNKLSKTYYNLSYIGSQADKLDEALKGLSNLLNDMPFAEGTFNSAKELILQEIRSQRISKADLLFNYLKAEQLGNTTDIRKEVFEKVQSYTFDDIRNFQNQNVKGKPTTVLVLGKKDRLNLRVLERYGPVRFLSLEDVFGY